MARPFEKAGGLATGDQVIGGDKLVVVTSLRGAAQEGQPSDRPPAPKGVSERGGKTKAAVKVALVAAQASAWLAAPPSDHRT